KIGMSHCQHALQPEEPKSLTTVLKTALLLALLLPTIGCGMSEQAVDEKMQPLRDDNAKLRKQLQEAVAQVQTDQGAIKSAADKAVKDAGTYVRDEIATLDKKYEDYNRTATTFKHLTDGIDTLKTEQQTVYKNLAESVDALRRVYTYERQVLKTSEQLVINMIQLLDKEMAHLQKLTGQADTSGGGGGGGNGGGDNR
ncbi:MAG: hypothetical protein AB7K09_21045, partial [Planctomycetota bacterium]